MCDDTIKHGGSCAAGKTENRGRVAFETASPNRIHVRVHADNVRSTKAIKRSAGLVHRMYASVEAY